VAIRNKVVGQESFTSFFPSHIRVDRAAICFLRRKVDVYSLAKLIPEPFALAIIVPGCTGPTFLIPSP
jgi:hypothetical protein